MERRRFISIVGGGAVGIVLPYAVYRYLMQASTSATSTSRNTSTPARSPLSAPSLPTTIFISCPRMASRPSILPSGRSTIDGLVDQPLRFSYDEIRALAPYETRDDPRVHLQSHRRRP